MSKTVPNIPTVKNILEEIFEENFSCTGEEAAEIISDRFDSLLKDYQDRGPCLPNKTRQEFIKISKYVGLPLGSFSREILKEQWYYRARQQFPDHLEKRFEISQFHAPPAQFTGLGRANLSNHPVFYGAENVITAIEEVIDTSVPTDDS